MCKINPRVDFAFKLIFERNKDLLISLINAVVSQKDQVDEIEVKNPYTTKKCFKDKFAVLDIRAHATTGTWYNIEMQVAEDLYYDRRSLYYWSKVYAEQLQTGDNYKNLSKTIGIHLLNFNVLEEKKYHNVFHIYNEETKKRFSDRFELHYSPSILIF